MDEGNYTDDRDKQVHRHLSLPEFGAEDHDTIYKLTLSMKRRLSPLEVEQTITSPVEAGEVRDLLRRLVEIDNESRILLSKVFSLLEKDESLEANVKNRIEDPKVSRMWQLVEQVIASQEGELNLDEVIMGDDDSCNYGDYIIYDKGIPESDEKDKEKKSDRFKVKNIGTAGGGAASSGTAGATSTTNAGAK